MEAVAQVDHEVASAPCRCREPLCSYFSRDAPALRSQVLSAFSHEKHGPRVHACTEAVAGAAETPAHSAKEDAFPLALLVPHGAAADSFPVAAHAYNELTRVVAQRPIRTIFFVGNNHRSPGVALSDTTWRTPLGALEPESELIEALTAQGIAINNKDHEREHSIENQLPFLQVIFEGCDRLPRIIALSVGYRAFGAPVDVTAIAKTIGDVLRSDRDDEGSWAATTAIIGTTDYTHAGPGYRELPPDYTTPACGWGSAEGQVALVNLARARDKPVLDAVLTGGGATEIVQRGRNTSMCGVWAAALTVELGIDLGMAKRSLLKYAVSTEVSPHPSANVTGFAAIAMTSS